MAGKHLVAALPGNLDAAKQLASATGIDLTEIEVGRFPDGETKLRAHAAADIVFLYCTLDHPDAKMMPLLLAAAALRDLGARQIILITPYLCYMRQDKAFRPGEPVSQRVLAQILSPVIDGLITIDPHLHRVAALDVIFPKIRTYTISAASLLAKLIINDQPGNNVVLIGPDEESLVWTAAVANRIDRPYGTMKKIRHGDRNVSVSLDTGVTVTDRTVILIDDVVSTGTSLCRAAELVIARGAQRVEALAVHALCTDGDLATMQSAGIEQLRSTNSVAHSTNRISIAPLLADFIMKEFAI